MRLHDFSFKVKSMRIMSDKDLDLSAGLLCLEGSFKGLFLERLIGRKRFYGKVNCGIITSYRGYKKFLRSHEDHLMVVENPVEIDEFSLLDILKLHSSYLDKDIVELAHHLKEFADLFDVSITKRLKDLSSGQAQIGLTLVALALSPSIIVIREGLEAVSSNNILKIHQLLVERGVLGVFTSRWIGSEDVAIKRLRIDSNGMRMTGGKDLEQIPQQPQKQSNRIISTRYKKPKLLLLSLPTLLFAASNLIIFNALDQKEEFQRQKEGLSTGFFTSSSPDISKTSKTFISPVISFTLNNVAIEISYDYALKDNKLHRIGIEEKEAIATESFYDIFSTTNEGKNFLSSIGLEPITKSIVKNSPPTIFCSEKTVNSLLEEHLDYNGNLFFAVSSDLDLYDIDNYPIDLNSYDVFLPPEYNSMNLDGKRIAYYEPRTPFSPIYYNNSTISKSELDVKPNDYRIKYLTTDIKVMEPYLEKEALQKYLTLKSKQDILTISYKTLQLLVILLLITTFTIHYHSEVKKIRRFHPFLQLSPTSKALVIAHDINLSLSNKTVIILTLLLLI